MPPARTDLVDEALVSVGRAAPDAMKWPPIDVVHELIYRVGRVHRGEVKLRGQDGEVVDVIGYRDKLGYDRKVYRLHQHGRF